MKKEKNKEKSTVKIHLLVVVSKHSRKKDAEDRSWDQVLVYGLHGITSFVF